MCRYAKRVDEFHGWACTETDGACMFFIPDEKACYEEYGEGPLASEEESFKRDQKRASEKQNSLTVGQYVEELLQRAKGVPAGVETE